MSSLKVIGQNLKSALCPEGYKDSVKFDLNWHLTPWPKINSVPPLNIHNLHVKFESHQLGENLSVSWPQGIKSVTYGRTHPRTDERPHFYMYFPSNTLAREYWMVWCDNGVNINEIFMNLLNILCPCLAYCLLQWPRTRLSMKPYYNKYIYTCCQAIFKLWNHFEFSRLQVQHRLSQSFPIWTQLLLLCNNLA